MNLIPYNLFVYLNYLICGCWVVLPWVFNQNGDSNNLQTNILLSTLGALLFFVLASSKKVSFPHTEYLNTQIVVLVLFLHSMIVVFLPYLLGYTGNSRLFSLTYILGFIQLISILLTKIDLDQKNIG